MLTDSRGTGRNRWGYGGGTACRLPGCQLADAPQSENSSDQVVKVQAGQVVLHREPVANAERHSTADEYARAGDQRVLDQEMPDDVALARADGAPRSDLLRARADVKGGEAEDPECGNCDQQASYEREHDRGDAVRLVAALPVCFDG